MTRYCTSTSAGGGKLETLVDISSSITTNMYENVLDVNAGRTEMFLQV